MQLQEASYNKAGWMLGGLEDIALRENEGKRSKVTVYKCHAGPATLVRDNITELQEHPTLTSGR